MDTARTRLGNRGLGITVKSAVTTVEYSGLEFGDGSSGALAHDGVELGLVDPAERRYRRLVDSSPDAMCVHRDGRLVYVNAACVRWMAAASPDQLLDRELTEVVHPESLPVLRAQIAALREPGEVSQPSESMLLRSDGTTLEAEAVSVRTSWGGRPAYLAVFRDLTAQKAAQATLRYQATLVEHVSDAIIATDGAALVTSWNPAAHKIYRRPADRALGLPISAAVGAQLDPVRILADGGTAQMTHHAGDGSALQVRVSVTAMNGGYVLLCSDKTALRRAEQHFESVVASLEEGVAVLDHQGKLTSINPSARRLLGLESDDLLGDFVSGLRRLSVYDTDGRPVDSDARPLAVAMTTGQPVVGRVLGVDRPDGQRTWLSVSCRLLEADGHHNPTVLMSFSDITAQRHAAERLAHQATHDSLTGLPNRAHLIDRLDRCRRSPGALSAVLFIDLDNFKAINDEHGHDAGDTAIRVVAERLHGAIRKDDFVARLAGDEFVVLLGGTLTPTQLDGVIARIPTMLTEPIDVAGQSVRVSASIGVVTTSQTDTMDAAALLREADKAMYSVKSRRRGSTSSPRR